MDLKHNQECEDKKSDTKNDTSNDDKWYRSVFVWIQKTTCITDWLIFACTLAIAIIGCFQWLTLQKTDQTSRLRDRAFLYFSNPIIKPYPDKKEPVVYRNDIVIVNTGSMPARRVFVRHAWEKFPKSENITDPWPLVTWSSVQIASVIGPKHPVSFQGRGIPVSTIEDAQNSKIDIFVVMEAKYIDGFDLEKTRITQMSRKLRFDSHGGRSLGFTNTHNCTDNDCPQD